MCEFCGCAGRRVVRDGQAEMAKPRSQIRMPVFSAPLTRKATEPNVSGGKPVTAPSPDVRTTDRLTEPLERGAR